MSNKVIRHLLSLWLALCCLATSAAARAGKLPIQLALRPPAPTVEGEPTPLTLDYTRAQTLPLGLRLDLTPALVIARDKRHLGTLLGYSGTVALNTWGDLFVVAGRVESRALDERTETEWSVQVTLGEGVKLPAKAIAGHVLSRARSVIARVL